LRFEELLTIFGELFDIDGVVAIRWQSFWECDGWGLVGAVLRLGDNLLLGRFEGETDAEWTSPEISE
jgi:hypothetical protein